jgi:hypothetical protein
MEIAKYGTEYGGWFLPKEIFLNEDSVIYSAGAGEDISFDIILSSRFNSNIILIDPTKRAYDHYIECYNFYKSNKAFSQRIKTDYSKILLSEKPNFSKITFLKVGLWHESGQLKFYKQNNLSAQKDSLFLSGALSKDSTIFTLLYNYIADIEFVKMPTELKLENAEDLPEHLFFDILSANL